MSFDSPWLMLGDCVACMGEIPDASVDLTVTSPPYDSLRKYNGYSFDFEAVARELYRVTKPGGVVVWVVGDATVKGSETGTSFRQALYFRDACGFNLHDTMIYRKANPGIAGSNYCYLGAFEYMFVFSKGRPNAVNLIKDRRNLRSGMTTAGSNRRGVDGSTAPMRRFEQAEFGRRFNIWEYPTGGRAIGHPAPFPEALARDHILSWSNPGDTVFDPFMGSGTTGKMAVLADRKFIGVELSDQYFHDIAVPRITAAVRQRHAERDAAANPPQPSLFGMQAAE